MNCDFCGDNDYDCCDVGQMFSTHRECITCKKNKFYVQGERESDRCCSYKQCLDCGKEDTSKINKSGYSWQKGAHCGSSALRDLLAHHTGAALSEALVLGLGCGAEFIAVNLGPGGFYFSGRGAGDFFADACDALGVRYTSHQPTNAAEAFAGVRDWINTGKPAVVFGDTYHLPHFPGYRKSHFPHHSFVLLGIDEAAGTAYVAERNIEEPVPVPLEQLSLSRDSPGYAMSSHGQWAFLHDGPLQYSLADACLRALRLRGRRGHRVTSGENALLLRGEEAIAQLRTSVEKWAASNRAADVVRVCTITEIFEDKGSGGGNFRRLYGEFLCEARAMLGVDVVPEEWSASAFGSAASHARLRECATSMPKGETEEARIARGPMWERLLAIIDDIAAAEASLFNGIAQRFGESALARL